MKLARQITRQFRSRPSFTAFAILILALGAAANAIMFSIIDTVLLRALPYPEPDRLVLLTRLDARHSPGPVSLPNFSDWQIMTKSFSSMAAYREIGIVLQVGAGEAIEENAVAATTGLFDVLRQTPMLGRSFAPDEDQPGKPCVAVLSASVWRERFEGTSGIIGRHFTMDRADCVVIGVTRPGFSFPPGTDIGLWATLRPTPELASRNADILHAVGRLKNGVSLHQAYEDLRGVSRQMAATYPVNRDTSIGVTPYQETIIGQIRPALLSVFGATLLVLLIASANVAQLQLGRVLDRQRELAIRGALGASRLRIGALLLAEIVILSVLGAVVGLIFAFGSLRALQRLLVDVVPRITEVHLDWTVYLFVVILVGLCGVVLGCGPVFYATRRDLDSVLREHSSTLQGGVKQRIWLDTLAAGQIAMSIALLAASGLLLQSFYSLLQEERSFSTSHVLTFQTRLSDGAKKFDNVATFFFSPELQLIEHIPGVKFAGLVSYLPLEKHHLGVSFVVPGHNLYRSENGPMALLNAVSPGYFRALGIPLLRGRLFGGSDSSTALPVAIVNNTFADRYFPGEDPLGKQISFDNSSTHRITIVGVVKDTHQKALSVQAAPELYLNYNQMPATATFLSGTLLRGTVTFVVAGYGDPRLLLNSIRRAIHSVDTGQEVFHVETMDRVLSSSVRSRQMGVTLSSVFALLALIVSSVGLYAVLYYTVSRRRQEFALRMALGAEKKEIFSMIIVHAGKLSVIGAGVGLSVLFVIRTLLGTFIVNVQPWNAGLLAGTFGILLFVVVAASLHPALTATSTDPAIVLRA